MGVEKYGNGLGLYCDICGEIAEETFFDYREVADFKKTNGWKSKKEFGEWFDTCPGCQEKQ